MYNKEEKQLVNGSKSKNFPELTFAPTRFHLTQKNPSPLVRTQQNSFNKGRVRFQTVFLRREITVGISNFEPEESSPCVDESPFWKTHLERDVWKKSSFSPSAAAFFTFCLFVKRTRRGHAKINIPTHTQSERGNSEQRASRCGGGQRAKFDDWSAGPSCFSCLYRNYLCVWCEAKNRKSAFCWEIRAN